MILIEVSVPFVTSSQSVVNRLRGTASEDVSEVNSACCGTFKYVTELSELESMWSFVSMRLVFG